MTRNLCGVEAYLQAFYLASDNQAKITLINYPEKEQIGSLN